MESLQSLSAIAARISASFRDDLVEIALLVAEEVIGAEIASGSPCVGARIDRALAAARTEPPLTVVGNPADRASLLRWSKEAGVPIELSAEVPCGDAKVRLRSGELQVSLRHHLSSVQSAVHSIWKASGREGLTA